MWLASNLVFPVTERSSALKFPFFQKFPLESNYAQHSGLYNFDKKGKTMKSQRTFYFSKKTLTSIIGSLTLGALAHTAVAQIGSASVQGVVASHSQPQPGIEVTAKNVDSGYTFRTLTLKDGSYTFKGLAPGHYQIVLKDKAGKAPETIVLKVGQAASLDFEIDKPVTNNDEVEEITVIGTQFKIKSTSGEIGTNVSLEQINKLPQNTRNFLAFADLAPGVQFNQSGDGSTKIKGGAQSANSINVFIDGVGQKNYVLGGGITGQDSSRGNPFPQSAIGEYKVITQNYSAEYDQLSSAAIVAVTASGTNELHGSFFYDYSDEGMREQRPSEIKSKEKIPSKQSQYGFSVGGPIIQDKMHFFFAYEAKDNADPKDVVAGAGAGENALLTPYRSQMGGISADFEEDLYFGKLDYLISDQQKIELSAKIRKETELTHVGGIDTLSYGTDKNIDEKRIDFNHNLRTDNWINDAHLTYEDASFNPRPHTSGIGTVITNEGHAGILNLGAGRDFQDKGQKGWAIQDDYSYLAIPDNVVKVGFKYKTIELHAREQQPYSPQFYYNMDFSLTQPYKAEWGAPLAGIGDGNAVADNKQFGIYIQDDWTATDNLTVNVGVRWDYEESDSFLNYKTPADVVAGINIWDGINKSDININDFISTGNNRDAFKNAWQPRVGFTYKLNDDHDVSLFGGIGRAYDRNLFDNLQLETTKATFPTYTALFSGDDDNPCGASCVTWDTKYLTPSNLAQLQAGDKASGREVFMINNNLKTPYSDQVSFGIRGKLDKWNAEVSLSHIQSRDGFVWLLGNRRADGSFYAPGNTSGAPWGFGIPGFSATIIGENGIETDADSLFIKLEKPRDESNWSMAIAYTFTDAQSNRKADEIFSFDHPNLKGYGVHDVTGVPEHRLVISYIVGLPGDIDFSAKLNLQSMETFYGTDCRASTATNEHCIVNAFKPSGQGFLGYKTLDVSFSKNISTGNWLEGSNLGVRLDILNLTNAVNNEGYEDWFGGAGESLPENFGKPNGNIKGTPLTMKLGVNWNW